MEGICNECLYPIRKHDRMISCNCLIINDTGCGNVDWDKLLQDKYRDHVCIPDNVWIKGKHTEWYRRQVQKFNIKETAW